MEALKVYDLLEAFVAEEYSPLMRPVLNVASLEASLEVFLVHQWHAYFDGYY